MNTYIFTNWLASDPANDVFVNYPSIQANSRDDAVRKFMRDNGYSPLSGRPEGYTCW